MAWLKFIVSFIDHDGESKQQYVDIEEGAASVERAKALVELKVKGKPTGRDVSSTGIASQIEIISIEKVESEGKD